MIDLAQIIPFETMVYAAYIAEDNERLFDLRQIRLHGRRALSQALIEGTHFMAGKRKNGQANANFNPVTWVNYSLTDENVDEIEGWECTDGELLAALVNMVDTGHSITIKQAGDGDGFMAAATGISNECQNKGLGLSAYAPDARSAAKVLVYKHVGVFDRLWPRREASQKPLYR